MLAGHFLNQIRKIPIRNEEESDEGHPPGENDEANSDEQSESVGKSQSFFKVMKCPDLEFLYEF